MVVKFENVIVLDTQDSALSPACEIGFPDHIQVYANHVGLVGLAKAKRIGPHILADMVFYQNYLPTDFLSRIPTCVGSSLGADQDGQYISFRIESIDLYEPEYVSNNLPRIGYYPYALLSEVR